MNESLFESLRWMDEPTRIKVLPKNGRSQVFFQITSPRDVKALCLGRAVEELPRILTILSPAHHLASAMALDHLFGVEPPPLAIHLREALRQTLFFEHHLRKLYFFLASRLASFNPIEGKRVHAFPDHPVLKEVMNHLALSQEALTILGGRPNHPLCAVAGGISRGLKDETLDRLAQIADSCLKFAIRLGEILGFEFEDPGQAGQELAPFSLAPLSSLTLSEDQNTLVLRDGSGKERDRFLLENLFEKIELHHESWSYEPFVFLKDPPGNPDLIDRVGIQGFSYQQCFFVGPLARLNQGTPLTPLAEQAKQRLLAAWGPLPLFDIPSAFWSLYLELLQAAEKLSGLAQEKKIGPETRTIPKQMGLEGRAALESPKGLIYHYVTTDEKGLVTDLTVLDTATFNNAWRCLWAQRAIERGLSLKDSPQEIKKSLELILLPF